MVARALSSCAALYEKNRVLALGQFISLLIALTGVFTQTLNQSFQIQIPVTQSAGNYLLLCVYLAYPIMRYRSEKDYALEIPLWKYLLLALADVEGNFLVVCAYKYTSISSAMLLDCFTIPVVMLLSALFLDAKYTRLHFVAVSFCLGGITILVVSDILRDRANWSDETSAWNASALYGDFLCLVGSAIYACSNVGQEYLVKKKNRRVQFWRSPHSFNVVQLAKWSFWACLDCVASSSAPSRQRSLKETSFARSNGIVWIGLAPTVFQSTSFIRTLSCVVIVIHQDCTKRAVFAWIFLKDGDAAVFNLSLLTSDFFAVVAAKYLFDEELSWLYFVGFSLIIVGILVYNRSLTPTTALDDALEAKERTTTRLLPLQVA